MSRALAGTIMVLSQVFRSPFVRVPFLGFAIVATVATSQASDWQLDDSVPAEHLAAPPGGSAERSVSYEASEASVEIEIALSQLVTKGGKLRVLVEECGIDGTFDQREANRWYPVNDSGQQVGSWAVSPHLTGHCFAKTGTFTVRVENLGGQPVTLDLAVSATITGPGAETPKDAFLRLESAL